VKSLLNLFISFMIIGIGAYGGGLVTIPLIQHEIITKNNWLFLEEMAEIFAISQMTPGPIAINAATFTGFRIASISGATVATAAVILPSILILTLLVPIINKFRENRYFRRLRNSMQLGVLSLIFFAVWSYGSAVIKGFLDLGIAIAAFLLLVNFEKKLHPIVVILTCGVLGLIIF
jgi:chromate transporter